MHCLVGVLVNSDMNNVQAQIIIIIKKMHAIAVFVLLLLFIDIYFHHK